jgi:hypothetical protein
MLRHVLIVFFLFVCVTGTVHAADVCQTTLPIPSFTPPSGYPQDSSPGTFWYGTPKLWTHLSADGIWKGNGSGGSYVTKLVFWRQGFDWRTERNPNFVVTARRLDGGAPAVVLTHARPVFITTDHPAMMVGLTVPTAGCWNISAYYGGTQSSLSFQFCRRSYRH